MTMKQQFNAAARDGRRGDWRRGNLSRWRKSHDATRRDWDARLLNGLLAAAAQSPTAIKALQWARDHGIEIIIDHRVNAGGYYHPGTGVVAVAAGGLIRADEEGYSWRNPVGVLVHEIRHAWQDYHGLIYCPGAALAKTSPLGRDLAIEGLFEADAEAHAALVRCEYDAAYGRERLAMLEAAQDLSPLPGRDHMIATYRRGLESDMATLANPRESLWQAMLEWYDPFGFNTAYGDARRDLYASALGLGGTAPDHGFEYLPPRGIAANGAPDFWRREVVEKLGRSFAGVNYLAGRAPRDVLLRRMLPPARSEVYFPEDDADIQMPNRRTREIRRAQLRHRLK